MHWMHALEELDGVMELLRASSDEESHSSNDDVCGTNSNGIY
jgi:hypothetical protein